jgi:hypothetical protein
MSERPPADVVPPKKVEAEEREEEEQIEPVEEYEDDEDEDAAGEDNDDDDDDYDEVRSWFGLLDVANVLRNVCETGRR